MEVWNAHRNTLVARRWIERAERLIHALAVHALGDPADDAKAFYVFIARARDLDLPASKNCGTRDESPLICSRWVCTVEQVIHSLACSPLPGEAFFAGTDRDRKHALEDYIVTAADLDRDVLKFSSDWRS